MTKFKQIDLSGVKTISIKDRKSKVTPNDFAIPLDAKKASSRILPIRCRAFSSATNYAIS